MYVRTPGFYPSNKHHAWGYKAFISGPLTSCLVGGLDESRQLITTKLFAASYY
jgi:hypothetical protein